MAENPEDESIEELDEPLAPLTAEHRERVLKALDTSEEAQHKLYDAAELLCPVPGFSEEWDGVRAAGFAVKDRWKAVEAAFRMLDAPNR
jgi:hypothetical protein